jgi:hypothetical protein
VAKFRHRLLIGEDTFVRSDGENRPTKRRVTWMPERR